MLKESKLCGQDDEDVFQKAGVQLPAHLNTETRRWCVLLLVAAFSGLTIGPMLTFATLEPLLRKEGVWAGDGGVSKLSTLISIGGATALISAFFAGILYDAIGPRALSSMGMSIAAVSFAGMALAIQVHHLNNLLWIAVPVCLIGGGGMAQMGPFSWLSLLPEHTNIVAAIIGILQILPGLLNLAAVALNASCGLRVQTYFAILSGLMALSALIMWTLIPSQEDLVRIAHMGTDQNGTDIVNVSSREYGAISDEHDDNVPAPMNEKEVPAPTVREAFQKSWVALTDTCKLLCKVHPTISFIFFFYQVLQYLCSMYPTVQMYPLYLDLMGRAKATKLVDIWSIVSPCVGSLATLLIGWFTERFDLVQATGWLIIPTVVQAIALSMRSLAFQVVGQISVAILFNAFRVLQVRFAILYGPPELFGTIYGSFNVPQGVAQVALFPFFNWIFTNPGGMPQPRAEPILKSIYLWCTLTVGSSLLAVFYWWYHPLPEPGSTTMADISDPEADLDGEHFIEEERSLLASEQPTCKNKSKQKSTTSARNCWACLKINHV